VEANRKRLAIKTRAIAVCFLQVSRRRRHGRTIRDRVKPFWRQHYDRRRLGRQADRVVFHVNDYRDELSAHAQHYGYVQDRLK
jgi:hypothetical protein